MKNINNNEKRLFSLMKNGLSNDYISIDKSFIPKYHSNNLNRFFIEDDSFWFSRLKIKDGDTIYYFGFDKSHTENIKPDLILSCNNHSSIRFIKNKIVILVKFKNNNFNIVKSLSKYVSLSTNNKLKEKGLYFIILGETSNEIFENIKSIMEHANYDLGYDDSYLEINDSSDNVEFVNEPKIKIDVSLNVLNKNLQILKIKNYLKEIPFDPIFVEKIIGYLFSIDENFNYKLNDDTFSVKIPFNDCIIIINELLYNYEEYLVLNLENSLNKFKMKLNNYINSYFDNINSFNNCNEIFSNTFEEINGCNEFQDVMPDNNVSFDKHVDLSDTQKTLYEKFLSLKETPKIKFHLIPSLRVSQEDLVDIFKNIKLDINKGIITEEEDINIIFEKYIRKYVSENKSKRLWVSFDEFILSKHFNELLKEYNDLNDVDVEDIKNKVKIDIESNNMEIDMQSRFEKYFSKKSLELQYIKLLSEKFENRSEYQKSGLKFFEIQEIFDEIKMKIVNWHKNWSILEIPLNEIINTQISIKQREIRSETRQEFEKVFPNKKIIKDILKKLFIKQEDYDKLKKYIYQDIYNLKIRKEDINNDLIFKYYEMYISRDLND